MFLLLLGIALVSGEEASEKVNQLETRNVPQVNTITLDCFLKLKRFFKKTFFYKHSNFMMKITLNIMTAIHIFFF